MFNIFKKKINFNIFLSRRLIHNKNKRDKDKDAAIKLPEIVNPINIPKTNFNERLNIKETEYNLISKITQEFYEEQLNDKERKLWVTHDGPPFSTGKPHLGTLMNKVIKDVVNRMKILQGYRVNFNIGFDCHGVDIEDQVMHKIKVNIHI